MLKRATEFKRFKQSPLGSELKKQTKITRIQTNNTKRHYLGLDKENDKVRKELEIKKYKESDLVYNNKYSLYKYNDTNKFKRKYFETKYVLVNFRRDLNKFKSLETCKGRTKENKINVYKKVSELYNELLGMYFGEYINFSVAKSRTIDSKCKPKNSFLGDYDCDDWYEELFDTAPNELVDMPPMLPEKVIKNCLCTNPTNNKTSNRRKRIKSINSNKLLTRLPILLAQIITRNN